MQENFTSWWRTYSGSRKCLRSENMPLSKLLHEHAKVWGRKWAWSEADISRLKAVSMRYLSSTEGNTQRREQEMRKEKINDKHAGRQINKQQKKWYGHILKINEESIRRRFQTLK
jgi:hypothetical protein